MQNNKDIRNKILKSFAIVWFIFVLYRQLVEIENIRKGRVWFDMFRDKRKGEHAVWISDHRQRV